jgi:hypothetical protein
LHLVSESVGLGEKNRERKAHYFLLMNFLLEFLWKETTNFINEEKLERVSSVSVWFLV